MSNPTTIFIYFIIIYSSLIICLRGEEGEIFTNTWAIQTDSEASAKRIANRYRFVYKGQIASLQGYYLLENRGVAKRRRRHAHSQSRRLSSDPAIIWSEQQRVLKRVKRGYKTPQDPLFEEQWYLENTGQAYGPEGLDINVLPVWKKGITGKGVVVTIIDDGIEYSHPDLKQNYDPKASYDYNSYDSDPAPRYTEKNLNKHGTRCAGEVAAAYNNGVCGTGVAYNAKIGGIRMLDGEVTDVVEAYSLGLAPNYIDIYSSSWGPEDEGLKVDGPASLTKRVLRDGVRRGRNGLGSIFVWATGNGGDYFDYCNCDGYITSIYTISVGAVNDQGKSPWYAEACPSTLAVCYSSGEKNEFTNKKIVTTDLHQSCTKSHTGTSAAAPLAAGIFALVLEANPKLTWRDLQHLIVNTSKITDESDDGWQNNSAGFRVNNKYGFGVLDAAALVEAASSPNWKTAPEQHVCREVEHVDNERILPKRNFYTSIYTNGCGLHSDVCVTKLEHVSVHVTLQHERRGAIEINLISPTGTVSKLLGLRRFDSSIKGFNSWPFMTVFHWGENPVGLWKLEVVNRDNFRGTFKRWSLRLYGTCSHSKTNITREIDNCDQLCQIGCQQPFSRVCVGCVEYCDCTTGECTARCRRELETDEVNKQCGYPDQNTSDNQLNKPDSNHDDKSLPSYGLWLLIAAGMAVTIAIIAGIWQGWLYYKARRKIKRDQERDLVHPQNCTRQHCATTDVDQCGLNSTSTQLSIVTAPPRKNCIVSVPSHS